MPDSSEFKFMKSVYFAVTNNPKDDVNPFSDLEAFGKVNVGALRWGVSDNVKRNSKIRFANNFRLVLQHYQVFLPIQDVIDELDDNNVNNDVVQTWVTKAIF